MSMKNGQINITVYLTADEQLSKGILQETVTAKTDLKTLKLLHKKSIITSNVWYSGNRQSIKEIELRNNDLAKIIKATIYKKLRSNRTTVTLTEKEVKQAIQEYKKKQDKENKVICNYCKKQFDKRKTKYEYDYMHFYHEKCYKKLQEEREEQERKREQEQKRKREQEQKKKHEQEIQKLKETIKHKQQHLALCKQQNLEKQQELLADKIKFLKALLFVRENCNCEAINQFDDSDFEDSEDEEAEYQRIGFEDYEDEIPYRCLTALQRFEQQISSHKFDSVVRFCYFIAVRYDNDPHIICEIFTEHNRAYITVCSW
ncbi:MAG: hypothetical protein ACTSUF_03395 [Candidatus Heimdallarchaeaceae archaeon]